MKLVVVELFTWLSMYFELVLKLLGVVLLVKMLPVSSVRMQFCHYQVIAFIINWLQTFSLDWM